MNKLTSARTLREIADLHRRQLWGRRSCFVVCRADVPPAATSSPNCAPSPPSAPAIRREMLDLDAGIESDLGIDSIKRVEILTALQKLGTPDATAGRAGHHEQTHQRPHAA